MTALRDRIGRIRTRVSPGAGGFFDWWLRSLAAWLPARWRATLGLGRDRLLLADDNGALQLRLQAGDSVRDLGRLPAGTELGIDADPLASVLAPAVADLPRWLVLPAAAGLRRRLTLPAAAAERLREVVSFEIDRQTPFAADAVAYDARVLARRPADGQLDAELIVVPLAALQPRLDALGPLASTLSGIDLADSAGAPLGVNLLPPAQRRQRMDPWRVWNWALGAIVLVALATGLWQVLANRRTAADAFETSIDARAADARNASLQRQRLIDAVEGQSLLDQMRAGRPSAIEIIDELSRRLPDTTYLEKLAIEGDKLILIGLSSEASSLPQRLEGSKLWRAPALTGALQQDPRTRRDRFTLMADLAVVPPTIQNRTATTDGNRQERADAGNADAAR